MKPAVKLAILFAAFAAAIGCRFGQPTRAYSDGWRQARIEKISRKGLAWKTWEGRGILQGYDKDANGNMVVRTFDFSVLDQDAAIIPDLEKAAASNKPVNLHYRQDWMTPVHYDSSYFVDKVEAGQ